jgi:hypothetical protein
MLFRKSILQNGVPETVTIDKSGANPAALHAVNAGRDRTGNAAKQLGMSGYIAMPGSSVTGS